MEILADFASYRSHDDPNEVGKNVQHLTPTPGPGYESHSLNRWDSSTNTTVSTGNRLWRDGMTRKKQVFSGGITNEPISSEGIELQNLSITGCNRVIVACNKQPP